MIAAPEPPPQQIDYNLSNLYLNISLFVQDLVNLLDKFNKIIRKL